MVDFGSLDGRLPKSYGRNGRVSPWSKNTRQDRGHASASAPAVRWISGVQPQVVCHARSSLPQKREPVVASLPCDPCKHITQDKSCQPFVPLDGSSTVGQVDGGSDVRPSRIGSIRRGHCRGDRSPKPSPCRLAKWQVGCSWVPLDSTRCLPRLADARLCASTPQPTCPTNGASETWAMTEESDIAFCLNLWYDR